MNYWTQSTKNIWVAAHRGWCEKYPENTMIAFKEAVKLGVDQLEIDVRVTLDNELVIIHDSTVDRTTNGMGKVCEKTLAAVASRIQLGQHLLLGNGEEQGGGRTRDSILADAVESVIAAAFLDGGMVAAKQFIQKYILVEVPVTKLHNIDYKTALQELVQQKKNQVLSYTLVGQSGPDHDKRFDVELSLNGKVVGCGSGSSKKRAEQDAAHSAMKALFPDKC